ncbi:MAG: VanZ family protein [Akkermansiaceae bacterium]|nr:VanZ family protein [Akkermansiaceae bacterium]MCF7733971.1 VanZ family protein [Akkermansiaceae bacterium]
MKRHIPTLVFFGFLCWIIYLADAARSSVFFQWAGHLPGGDKLGHFCLFGLLALLLNRSLGYRSLRLGRLRLPLGAVLVMLFAIGEELTQLWFPNRTFDLADLAADLCGVVTFSLLQWRLWWST